MLNKTIEDCFNYSFWFYIKVILKYIFYFNTNVLPLKLVLPNVTQLPHKMVVYSGVLRNFFPGQFNKFS
jgi:hypothetical protein